MIGTTSIDCISVERYAYLFCQVPTLNVNKCFGRLFEQENDAGECQYVYDIWQDKLSDKLLRYVTLPGIDLTLRQKVYVRSGELPYFIECSSPRNDRTDTPIYLRMMKMEHNDQFEYMMRSRAITHHTNCYLGRNENDLFDALRARNDKDFWFSNLPNLNEEPQNVFHKAEPLFDEVNYSTEIYLKETTKMADFVPES